MSKFPENKEFNEKLGNLQATPPANGWEGVVGALSNSSGEFVLIGAINTAPPPHVWSNIAATLDPGRKRRAFYWWWSGAAAAVFIGLLFGYNNLSSSYEGLSSGWTITPPQNSSTNDLIQNNNEFNKENTTISENGFEKDIDVDSKELSNNSKDTIFNEPKKVRGYNNEKDGSEFYNKPKRDYNSSQETNLAKVDTKEHLFDNWSIAFSEPKIARIPFFTIDNVIRRDTVFVPPPMPKKTYSSETLLAANFGATSKSNNISYGSNTNSFANADVFEQSVPGVSVSSVYNVTTEVIDYSQSLPITFGMNLRKTIGRNWYLSSGLSYSGTSGLLSYTVNSEIETLRVKDHYAGVPISIGLNFLDKRRFHLFSSISHLNEALLVRTEINSYPESVKSSSFVLSPQFGIGANLGLLFKLKNGWGISTAFSAKSYYIAPQNSYWKSQKIWPSLNVSVVYNLHKKELFK